MADISITASAVVPSSSATIASGKAGEAINAGQLVYKDATDSNKIKLADANSAAKVGVIGMAINSAGAAGQYVTYVTKDPELTIGGTRTVGAIYILSATAGGVAPVADLTTGWYSAPIAVVKTATAIALDCTHTLKEVVAAA